VAEKDKLIAAFGAAGLTDAAQALTERVAR